MLGRARRIATSAGLAFALAAGAGASAFATVEYVGGGEWEYGQSDEFVWSNYHHFSYCHGSSAEGAYLDRDEAPSRHWSYASAPTRWYAVDKAYWNVDEELPYYCR